MAQEKVIKIRVDADEAVKDVEKLNEAIDKTTEATDGASDATGELGGAIDGAVGGSIGQFKGMLSSVKSVVGAFKTLKGAIIATGLGALLVAVVAIASAFTASEEGQNKWTAVMEFFGLVVKKVTDVLSGLGEIIIKVAKKGGEVLNKFVVAHLKLFDAITFGVFNAEKAYKKLGDSIDKVVQKAKDRAKEIGDTDKLERKLITDRAEADRKRSKLLLDSENRLKFTQQERIAFLKEAGKIEDEIVAKEIKAAKSRLKIARDENKGDKDSLTARAELAAKVIQLTQSQLDKQKEVQAATIGIVDEERSIQEGLTASYKANYDQRLADQSAYLKARIDAERQIRDIEIELLEDGREKELEANREQLKRKLEDLKANVELTAKERKRLEDLFREQAFEAEKKIELQNVQDIQLAIKPLKKLNRDELLKIDVNAGTAEIEEAKRVRDEKKKILQEEVDFKVSIIKGSFQTIADIASLFAGDDEARQRKAFNVQKAVSIAQATIDTYKGANAAFASGSAISPVFGFAAAAAAIAAGLVNVRNIAKQQFGSVGGASGGGGGSLAPALDPAQAVQQANFNVVGNTNFNQSDNLNKPVKAYVVGGDILTNQALERARLATATF